jgi:hypothetical protein
LTTERLPMVRSGSSPSALSDRTSSTRSPLANRLFSHSSGSSSVRENITLGGSFIRSAPSTG